MTEHKISFSRMNLFHRCPEQFRRRYLEREHVDHGLWAGAGSLFHQAAQNMTNPYQPEVMKRALGEIAQSYPQEYGDRALKYLPAFDAFMLGQETLGYEYVKTELELEVHENGLFFHGFVDLVQRGKKGLILTDWKLGKKRPADIAQLQTYAPFVAEQLGEPVSLLRDVYFTQKGTYKVDSFVPAMTRDQVLEVLDEVADLLYQPESAAPAYPAWGSLSDSCQICPFKDSCPGVGLSWSANLPMQRTETA